MKSNQWHFIYDQKIKEPAKLPIHVCRNAAPPNYTFQKNDVPLGLPKINERYVPFCETSNN